MDEIKQVFVVGIYIKRTDKYLYAATDIDWNVFGSTTCKFDTREQAEQFMVELKGTNPNGTKMFVTQRID
jgi:hypothetical protein